MNNRKLYGFGVILVLLGGVALSSGGIFIRYVQDTDAWAILFYRSAGAVSLILTVILCQHKRNTAKAFRAIGLNGVILTVVLGGGFTCYVFSMLLTTVANVAFIISAGPIFAALLGWLFLREKVSSGTWLVIIGAAVGMGLMFADGLSGGHILGTIIALGLPIAFASMVVLVRRAGDVDMLPATCLATSTGLVTGFILSTSLVIPLSDFLIILLMGSAQFGMGFMLITMGARHVPVAEVALLALSESVLAPIWAWLILAEIPGSLAMSGGVLVMVCVAIQAISGIRRERKLRY